MNAGRCQHATREDEGYRDGRGEKHGPFPPMGAGTVRTDPEPLVSAYAMILGAAE